MREVRFFDADSALVESTPAERICDDLDRILDELLVELDRVEPRLRPDDGPLERDRDDLGLALGRNDRGGEPRADGLLGRRSRP